MSRAVLMVLDSFGVGGAEDAARFGDQGSDTSTFPCPSGSLMSQTRAG